MEREEKEAKVIAPRRVGSYLILICALALIGASLYLLIDHLMLEKRKSDLEAQRKSLLEQIQRLDQLYNNLQDEDYYILYVQEYYYSGQ